MARGAPGMVTRPRGARCLAQIWVPAGLKLLRSAAHPLHAGALGHAGSPVGPAHPPSSPAPPPPHLPPPLRGRGHSLLPRSGPSSATQRPVSMAAARAAAQRRSRLGRHRILAADLQVPKSGYRARGVATLVGGASPLAPLCRCFPHSGRGDPGSCRSAEGDSGLGSRLCVHSAGPGRSCPTPLLVILEDCGAGGGGERA